MNLLAKAKLLTNSMCHSSQHFILCEATHSRSYIGMEEWGQLVPKHRMICWKSASVNITLYIWPKHFRQHQKKRKIKVKFSRESLFCHGFTLSLGVGRAYLMSAEGMGSDGIHETDGEWGDGREWIHLLGNRAQCLLMYYGSHFWCAPVVVVPGFVFVFVVVCVLGSRDREVPGNSTQRK